MWGGGLREGVEWVCGWLVGVVVTTVGVKNENGKERKTIYHIRERAREAGQQTRRNK